MLGANHSSSGDEGVFTDRKGVLSNDFFTHLLDMNTFWEVVDESGDEKFIGRNRKDKSERWTATRTDLVFGSNSQLRSVSEVYGERGHEEKFVKDFVASVDQGDGSRPLRSALRQVSRLTSATAQCKKGPRQRCRGPFVFRLSRNAAVSPA